MKTIALLISLLGLALVIGPALSYLLGSLDKETMKSLMLAGTLVWFVSVPFWMGRKPS